MSGGFKGEKKGKEGKGREGVMLVGFAGHWLRWGSAFVIATISYATFNGV